MYITRVNLALQLSWDSVHPKYQLARGLPSILHLSHMQSVAQIRVYCHFQEFPFRITGHQEGSDQYISTTHEVFCLF